MLPPVILMLCAASFGALIMHRSGTAGSLVVGAMLGAGVYSVLHGGPPVSIPEPLQTASFLVVGAAVGSTITRNALTELHLHLLPALLSAVLLILAGVAIACVLQALGFPSRAAILASAPGGFGIVSVLAAERGSGAAEIAVFHTVRAVLLVLALPRLLTLHT